MEENCILKQAGREEGRVLKERKRSAFFSDLEEHGDTLYKEKNIIVSQSVIKNILETN